MNKGIICTCENLECPIMAIDYLGDGKWVYELPIVVTLLDETDNPLFINRWFFIDMSAANLGIHEVLTFDDK